VNFKASILSRLKKLNMFVESPENLLKQREKQKKTKHNTVKIQPIKQ
jgi:hypothetical protein